MYIKFKDGKSKVLTLSYDDATVHDIKLIEIMDKYGLKGTFNINTGLYFKEDAKREVFNGRLKLSEAKELYKDSGHEIAVHGLTHPWLQKLTSEQVALEIIEDRLNIEREYGVIARGMAYPYGAYNDAVIEVLKNCGICYARTAGESGNFYLPKNWFILEPTCHHSDSRLFELLENFTKENVSLPHNRMFYLWGHSYEFNEEDNWNIIEEFAKTAGGRDDIWYATNIEIYDYVKAYESLQVSMDEKIIHNPTAIDVWTTDGREIFEIKAGETLYR